MTDWTKIEGTLYPPGASWVEAENAWNFVLYTRHATSVTLLIYAQSDLRVPRLRVPFSYLTNKSGHVWHCRVPGEAIGDAPYYAYLVDGPNDSNSGNRFDPEKILLDPYAEEVFFPRGFSRNEAINPGSNSGRAPLGRLLKPSIFQWGVDPRPRHRSDTVIYEMHVGGFTRSSNSGVDRRHRGTYAGVIEKIPYLQELGVTVVELLPVYQFDPGEKNYWGYMPLNFFSPHQDFSSGPGADGCADEFRMMVQALHRADIEVVLDVVYNHTAEQGDDGPTYSFRGIDNGTYYLLDSEMRYRNDTGCGNVVRAAHPVAKKLIIESMRYWVRQMHVDGFRFDLASILSRGADGVIRSETRSMIADITANADLAGIRLIAEPWDLDSYQLGRSFPGRLWAQWNGKFRDDIRSFLRGDVRKVTDLMRRLYGSDDLFPDNLDDAYRPYQSINFVTCHDGFCLYDLVSYNQKHNLDNGHDNTDGTDYNLSWNCGWEGDEGVSTEVLALRRQQIKNFFCLLMLANGTPMMTAGDEFMNTQRGNNNPYNQNNEITWLDWNLLERNRDIFRFFKNMIAFRKAHSSLGRSRFWREDIRWYGVGHDVDMGDDSHTLAYCLHGASVCDKDIYVMINALSDDLVFTIQEGMSWDWKLVIDTAKAGPLDFAEPGEGSALGSSEYTVKAHSVVVLLSQ
jgi:glycogen operon protein